MWATIRTSLTVFGFLYIYMGSGYNKITLLHYHHLIELPTSSVEDVHLDGHQVVFEVAAAGDDDFVSNQGDNQTTLFSVRFSINIE